MKRPFRTPSKDRQDPSASLGRIPPRAHRHRVARTGHGLPGPEAASQRRRGPAPGCTSGAAAPSARRRLRRPVRRRCPLHAPRPMPAPLTPAGAGDHPEHAPRGGGAETHTPHPRRGHPGPARPEREGSAARAARGGAAGGAPGPPRAAQGGGGGEEAPAPSPAERSRPLAAGQRPGAPPPPALTRRAQQQPQQPHGPAPAAPQTSGLLRQSGPTEPAAGSGGAGAGPGEGPGVVPPPPPRPAGRPCPPAAAAVRPARLKGCLIFLTSATHQTPPASFDGRVAVTLACLTTKSALAVQRRTGTL